MQEVFFAATIGGKTEHIRTIIRLSTQTCMRCFTTPAGSPTSQCDSLHLIFGRHSVAHLPCLGEFRLAPLRIKTPKHFLKGFTMKRFTLALVALGSLGLVFTGCKKDEKEAGETAPKAIEAVEAAKTEVVDEAAKAGEAVEGAAVEGAAATGAAADDAVKAAGEVGEEAGEAAAEGAAAVEGAADEAAAKVDEAADDAADEE